MMTNCVAPVQSTFEPFCAKKKIKNEGNSSLEQFVRFSFLFAIDIRTRRASQVTSIGTNTVSNFFFSSRFSSFFLANMHTQAVNARTKSLPCVWIYRPNWLGSLKRNERHV